MLEVKPPLAPMEALRVEELPEGPDWQYEPKWDGFRCLAFRDGDDVFLQSKAEKPLGRYFPEIVAAIQGLRKKRFVLDGELVVPVAGKFDFDQLLQRIHPAASRIRKLSAEYPARYFVFDLLAGTDGKSLIGLALKERRLRSGKAGGPNFCRGRNDRTFTRDFIGPPRPPLVEETGASMRRRDRQAPRHGLHARRAHRRAKNQAAQPPIALSAGFVMPPIRRKSGPCCLGSTIMTACCIMSVSPQIYHAKAQDTDDEIAALGEAAGIYRPSPAAQVVGTPIAPVNGRRSIRSWSLKSPSTTRPAAVFATARRFSAGPDKAPENVHDGSARIALKAR